MNTCASWLITAPPLWCPRPGAQVLATGGFVLSLRGLHGAQGRPLWRGVWVMLSCWLSAPLCYFPFICDPEPFRVALRCLEGGDCVCFWRAFTVSERHV